MKFHTITVEDQHHSSSNATCNSATTFKHGNGSSGGKFLSVPGKHSFGKNTN